MVLLALKFSLVSGLAVVFLVILEGGDLVLELLSSGEEEVVKSVLGSVDVNVSVLDVLLVAQNQRVVLIGSGGEIEL